MADTTEIYTIQIQRNRINADSQSNFCEVCKKGVIQLSSLEVRQFTQSGKLPNVCKLCNKEFLKACRMQIKSLTQPDLQPHICDICNKAFIHVGNLKKHKDLHVQKTTVPDEPNEEELEEPVDEKPVKKLGKEDPNRIYICKRCNRKFRNVYRFTSHCQLHPSGQTYFCIACNENFDSYLALKTHSQDHEAENQYICNLCHNFFDTIVLLKDHCLKMHDNTKDGKALGKNNMGKTVYTCQDCKKMFVVKVAYDRHILIHTGGALHTCDVCNKTYLQLARLRTHMHMHGRSKKFNCTTCPMTFSTRKQLAKHNLKHK